MAVIWKIQCPALRRLAGGTMLLALLGGAAAVRADTRVVSRGVPAFASDNNSAANQAVDNDYGTEWRSGVTPSASRPVWIALDLSGVASAEKSRVVVTWYNALTFPYNNSQVQGDVSVALPQDYTIDANAAPGGAVPLSGWVTLKSVTGNLYHSRAHVLSLSGYNWLRLRATRSISSGSDTDVSLNVDVNTAPVSDDEESMIFLGDSITAGGLRTRPVGGAGTYAQLVNAARPSSFPAAQDGGQGGLRTTDALRYIDEWLSINPAHYVGIAFGTNDIVSFPNSPSAVDTAATNLLTLVDKVIAAGKVPLLPTVPWARRDGVATNGAALRDRIEQIYAERPQVIPGPDFWTYYKDHPSLISSDDLHPTDAGYAAYRQQWAQTTVAAGIFGGGSSSPPSIVSGPTAVPNPVTGTRTALSALATDDGGEPALTYAWSTVGTPPAPVNFAPNGTNAAKSSTATFTAAGRYTLRVTATDATDLTASSDVVVDVTATLSSVTISPADVALSTGATQMFTAQGHDQFGGAMALGPVTWSVQGVGSVDATGRYDAGPSVGVATVTATSGAFSARAFVSVTQNQPLAIVSGPAADPNPVSGSTTTLSVAVSDADEPSVVYTWSTDGTPPAPVSFSPNGTNAAKNAAATFAASGSYTIRLTAKDGAGLQASSDVVVNVAPTMSSVTVSPSIVSLSTGAFQVFTASGTDQFGNAVALTNAVWSVQGVGSIDAAGRYGAGPTVGVATVTATSGGFTATAFVRVTANQTLSIVTGPTADPNPVSGSTTTLSVTVADADEPSVLYTWSTVGAPPAPVVFSPNGTNAAKNAAAAFAASGVYTIRLTAQDGAGLQTSSDVIVNVASRISSMTVSPASVSLSTGEIQVFTASAADQFGNAVALGTVTWSVTGTGSIDSTGRYDPGFVVGLATVTATAGARSAKAFVVVTATGPPVIVAGPTADPNPTFVLATSLSVTAEDNGGSAALVYTWSVRKPAPGTVTFDQNGTNAAQLTGATFSAPGTYTLDVVVRDQNGLEATGAVTVQARGSASTLRVDPASATLSLSDSLRFIALQSGSGGDVVIASPTWRVQGVGTIDPDGTYHAGVIAGTAMVTAAWRGLQGSAQVVVGGTDRPPFLTDGPRLESEPAGVGPITFIAQAGDLDNDTLRYTWTMLEGPAPLTFAPNGSPIATRAVADATAPGLYRVEVHVEDGRGGDARGTVQFIVPALESGAPARVFQNVINLTRAAELVFPVDTTQPTHIRGVLFDHRGRERLTVFDRDVPAGPTDVKASGSGIAELPPGSYTLRIWMNGSAFNRRVVVID